MKNQKEDSTVINLRDESAQAEDADFEENLSDELERKKHNFKIKSVDEELESSAVSSEIIEGRSTDMVKVSFMKFVNLVANHDYDELMENHKSESLFLKADLLAELADVPSQDEEKKLPIHLFIGVLIGLFLAWLLFK